MVRSGSCLVKFISRGNRARLPGVVLRASILYSLGAGVFGCALMDLILFVVHGDSLLGPALDVILVVFDIGLLLVSVVAVVTQKRNLEQDAGGAF